jgi:hypothetical protein
MLVVPLGNRVAGMVYQIIENSAPVGFGWGGDNEARHLKA